jgi:hypothetical protein
MTEAILQSTITCPECDTKSTETMPTNSCQYFWKCPSCKEVIKPKKGDCCVFCSYGDNPCPPVQNDNACC